MLLVAMITVEPGKLDEFRKYELAAAQIMARYNGVIERALVLPAIVTVPEAKVKQKRSGIMGAIEEVASEIDRGVEKLLHPSDPGTSTRELHVLRFPDEAAYEAYRADPELVQLAPLRARCVASTEVWRAEEGPTYRS